MQDSFIARLIEEQKLCFESITNWKDAFGILPAGFGNRIIFQLFLHILKDDWLFLLCPSGLDIERPSSRVVPAKT